MLNFMSPGAHWISMEIISGFGSEGHMETDYMENVTDYQYIFYVNPPEKTRCIPASDRVKAGAIV